MKQETQDLLREVQSVKKFEHFSTVANFMGWLKYFFFSRQPSLLLSVL